MSIKSVAFSESRFLKKQALCIAREICNSVTAKLLLAFFSNSLGKVLQDHLCLVDYKVVLNNWLVLRGLFAPVQTNLNIFEVSLCVYSNVNEE